MEGGEGSRLDNKGPGEGKASEKDRQESSISAPEVIPEKTDRAFREKGFQESMERNKTVKSSVKRCHSDDKGHKTDGDTKEADDNRDNGMNQSMQACNVDQQKGIEYVKKKSNADITILCSSFIHDILTKVAGIHQSHIVKIVEDPRDAKELFHRHCSPDITCYAKGQEKQATGTSSSLDGDMPLENDTSNSPGISKKDRSKKDRSSFMSWMPETFQITRLTGRFTIKVSHLMKPLRLKKENGKRLELSRKTVGLEAPARVPVPLLRDLDVKAIILRRENPASPRSNKRRRQQSSYSEEEQDSPERFFFKRHHNKMKHLPGSPKSPHDYMSRVFKVPNSNNE